MDGGQWPKMFEMTAMLSMLEEERKMDHGGGWKSF
jgi:hypothetical protein